MCHHKFFAATGEKTCFYIVQHWIKYWILIVKNIKMTLEEIGEDNNMECHKIKNVSIGRVTAEVIWQSLEKGRLWCGGYELANLMKSNPDKFMFCILPEVQHSDFTASIEQTLIQAICWENNIKILKVNDREKLSHLLTGRHKKKNKNMGSVSCVLLEYPSDSFTGEEKEVMDFYKWMKKTGHSTSHFIQLPV